MPNYDLSNEFKQRQFLAECKKHMEQQSYVTLERVPKPRTTNQNKYVHAIFGLLAAYTGFTVDEVKELAKRKFAERYEKNGVTFMRGTSEMSTADMTVFIDKLRKWGNEDIGCYCPSADEWAVNWKEIDEQIKSYKHR